MKIDFAKLQYQYQLYKKEIDQNIQAVLNKSNYIMGEEVTQLEEELQNFTQSKHAITCSSGTDALLLAMMAMDIQPDDEIITTPFTFIATAETIALMKAKPVFVDVDPVSYNINPNLIEVAITDKTKAIMPVGLYGQPADMDEINAIAQKHKLKVIIDGAQSFGATYQGKQEVHHCDIYTTSFFPAKPLGCYGDGGAVFTNNSEYAEKIKMMRVHGQNKRYHHKYIGIGGRLDTMQAAVLLAKLPHYADEIKGRQAVAQKYNALLKNQVTTPKVKGDRTSVWAQYTMRIDNRDAVQAKLQEQGIPSAVHYPMPLHQQECFQYLGLKQGDYPISEQLAQEVMSLPMNPFLVDEEIDYISQAVKSTIND
ncbi:MAG: DegT/DnrJ/EryC1/StrS family aminotransferase [Gammaproteobacteria bacterium]